MGTFVGTTASNREDQRATLSKSHTASVLTNCLRVSCLEKNLTALGNSAKLPKFVFSCV